MSCFRRKVESPAIRMRTDSARSGIDRIVCRGERSNRASRLPTFLTMPAMNAPATKGGKHCRSCLNLLDLPILQLQRCRPAEDGGDDSHHSLVGHDFVDFAFEVDERAVGDLDAVAL